MTGLTDLTAGEIVRRVHSREVTVASVATAFLDRIDRYDDLILAWETVDREQVMAQAAWLDSLATQGARLPLHGVPVGVKDIIDVAGLPTIAGFEPYRGSVAGQDAAIIAALRNAGALILGKTHTTQFAVGDPAPTRNPWNLEKSPSGSSAGSGAAVPAGMAALALGSQTAGSMLRPAAFNGSVGFKPTYGWYSLAGVIPLCWSLDHLGLYTTTVEDMSLAFGALTGKSASDPPAKPRIAVLTEFLDMADRDVASHTHEIIWELEDNGAVINETTLPESFDHLAAIHHVIMAAEMAANHSANLTRYPEHYGPRIRAGVEVGSLVPAAYLEQAQRHRRALAAKVAEFMSGYDALLLPTASTEACDRATTGDRRFQVPATLLGLPAISLPTGLSPNNLPLGTQLVGARGADHRLLGVAEWVSGTVPLIGRPDLGALRA